MLRYKLHRLELNSGTFLLLPKLTPGQVDLLRNRLASLGFKVSGSSRVAAIRPGQTIRVNPVGFCWSNLDPTDAVAPAIPDLLAAPSRQVSFDALKNVYFRSERGVTNPTVRFTPRVEGGSLWTELRASGACGLTPDEHSVVGSVLGSSSGGCRLLTDFPVEGSHVRIIGKKQYYDSALDPVEANSTLRVVGARGERNAYLPRDGIVHLDSLRIPRREDWLRAFDDLGEWCYFRAR